MPNAELRSRSSFGIRHSPFAIDRRAWLTAALLVLTVVYAVLQVGFVRPHLSADTAAQPRPAAGRWPPATRRARGVARARSTPAPATTPGLAHRFARLGARAPGHGRAGDRLHGRGDRAARAAQQRPDGPALGAGARVERRRGRRTAPRRGAGLSLRHLEDPDGLHLARRPAGVSDHRARDPVLSVAVAAPRRATAWLHAVPFVAAAPMLVPAAATSLYLVGVESMRDLRAVGRLASRRLLRILRAGARDQRRWRSPKASTATSFNHDANERRRIRMAVYTAVPGVFAYALEGRRPDRGDARWARRPRSTRGRSPRSCSCWCCCRRSG